MLELHSGPDVWSTVAPAIHRTRGRRDVAIAFVTLAAEELLKLRKGDRIFVNASKPAVRAGATDPKVLRRWHEGGVEVLVHETLHAKVVVTRRLVAVGSANGSYAAQGRSHEAVLVTDDDGVVAQCREFLADLADGAHQLTEEELVELENQYRSPKGGGLAGVTSTAPASPLLPAAPWTLHVVTGVEATSQRAQEDYERVRRATRRQPGFELDYVELRVEEADVFAEDDLMLHVSDDGDGEMATLGRFFKTSHRRSWSNVYYHYPVGKDLPVEQVRAAVRAAGYRWRTDSRIIDQDKIAVILAEWELGDAVEVAEDEAG
jgi:hypothetical protein